MTKDIKLTGKAWKINGSWVVTIPSWAVTQNLIDLDKDVEMKQ